jgi:branched-chain amino acid transport system substrate-binding protein
MTCSRSRTWLPAIVLTVAAGLLLGTVAPGLAATKSPYKVGAVFALSGPAASLGQPERDTALMLVKRINAAGGINGHPLELIVIDTAGDETTTVNAVKRLVERDKVCAIIGPSRTGTSLAVVPYIQEAKIPLISCAAGIQIVTPVADHKWVFKTPQSDVLAVQKIIKYLKPRKITRVAIMSESSAFGESGKTELERLLPKAGIRIVAKESFGDKDQDVTTQLARVKASKAQALIGWGTSVSQAVMVKNARQLRISIPVILSHGVANETFLKLAGAAANGVVFPAGKLLVASSLPTSDPQRALLIKYAADFKRAYGKNADTFGGHAYDALTLVTRALTKHGPNPGMIRTEIERTKNFVGIGGVFNFSPADHNGLNENAFAMVKVVNGKWVFAK